MGDRPPPPGILAQIPAPLMERLLRWGNYVARLSDRYLRTRLSHYGWGFVFRLEASPEPAGERGPRQWEWMPADINVCFSCGAGHPEKILLPRLRRFLLWRMYRCPSCGQENVFFGGSSTGTRESAPP